VHTNVPACATLRDFGCLGGRCPVRLLHALLMRRVVPHVDSSEAGGLVRDVAGENASNVLVERAMSFGYLCRWMRRRVLWLPYQAWHDMYMQPLSTPGHSPMHVETALQARRRLQQKLEWTASRWQFSSVLPNLCMIES
jgi:hypothetical protein